MNGRTVFWGFCDYCCHARPFGTEEERNHYEANHQEHEGAEDD